MKKFFILPVLITVLGGTGFFICLPARASGKRSSSGGKQIPPRSPKGEVGWL